jgi:hypothetical protein
LGDFTRPWAVSSHQNSVIKKTSSNGKVRASLLATLEVEYRAVTGGMLCARSISDSPQKVESNRGGAGSKFGLGHVS